MITVSLKDITPGMVLANAATDRNNRVLLAEGATLTEKHIKVFKTWGVTHVQIEGESNIAPLEEIIAAHPEFVAEADTQARHTFCHADINHPFFVALIDEWKKRYIRNRVSQP